MGLERHEQGSREGVGGRREFLLRLGGLGALGILGLGWGGCRRGKTPAPVAPRAPTTAPAPDLGVELFPDKSGKALAGAAEAPVIVVPRSSWTARQPDLGHIRVMNGVERITIHHTGFVLPEDRDGWRPTAGQIEYIREFHTGGAPQERGWADIAYHFVIDRAGRVWQGRPLAYQGAHVKGQNEHNLGIVLLGDFNRQRPAAAQLISLGAFVGFLRSLYRIPSRGIYTHGELGQTDCPGRLLQAYVLRARPTW